MLFKFESNNKELLPFHLFVVRVIRYALFSFVLIAISVTIGTTGYRYFAGLTWLDAFYNACMILTGMGPVSVMQNSAAKIFSSVYALFSGIIFLSTIAIIFAPIAHRIMHMMHIEE